MSNINLYQAESEKDVSARRRESVVGGGFYFSIFILLAVIVSWGAVKFIKMDFDKKKADLDSDLAKAEKEFSGGEANIERVYDFYKRTEFAKASIEAKPDQVYIFKTIEEEMVPEVKANGISYAYEKGVVEVLMELETPKFVDVARQILAIKESKFEDGPLKDRKKFSGVLVEEIIRADKVVNFSLRAQFTNNDELFSNAKKQEQEQTPSSVIE